MSFRKSRPSTKRQPSASMSTNICNCGRSLILTPSPPEHLIATVESLAELAWADKAPRSASNEGCKARDGGPIAVGIPQRKFLQGPLPCLRSGSRAKPSIAGRYILHDNPLEKPPG